MSNIVLEGIVTSCELVKAGTFKDLFEVSCATFKVSNSINVNAGKVPQLQYYIQKYVRPGKLVRLVLEVVDD